MAAAASPLAGTPEAKLAELESQLNQCAQDLAQCGPRVWLEIRWDSPRTQVSLLAPSGSNARAQTELPHDSVLRRLESALSAPGVQAPHKGGILRTWVLTRAQGWDFARVLIEKSTAQNRSVALWVDLQKELSTLPLSQDLRRWVFTPDGEVLFQSEGQFVGGQFKNSKHFKDPQSRLSFDALPVISQWKTMAGTGWLVLEETLISEPAPAAQNLGQGLIWGSGFILAGISFFRIRRKKRKPPNGVSLPAQAQSLRFRDSRVEVLVPQVLEAGAAPQEKPISLPSLNQWAREIGRTRSLLELGGRLMQAIAQAAQSPVLFLEYNRHTGLAVFRNQSGLPAGGVPLSLRVTVRDSEGESPLVAQPELQKILLQRLGVSHFEVLELRSATVHSFIGSRLLGLFVILQPGVRSFENRSYFERLLAEASKHHDSILRPTPPKLPPESPSIG
ncbi:MAG: hypothetical protein ACK5QT_07630 [Oligoflexia bacterium]